MDIEIKTIKELVEKVKSGEINESNLRVIMDNDMTIFLCGDDRIVVGDAGGYRDIEKLWPIIFPSAEVDWC